MSRVPNRHFWLLFNRTSLVLGAILLVGILGGSWWVWVFIHQRLTPLVETNLQQLLGRRVSLGEVESFSLNSLRFGASSIPATPTDSDRLAAKAVEVDFDPLELLFNRTLELNVTLVQPNVYIEQDKNGRWVNTTIQDRPQGVGLFKTELETIKVTNADVILAPFPQPGKAQDLVGFKQVNGIARPLDQRISYNINTQPVSGGNLQIAGETQFKTQQTNLKIQAENLLAADISRVVELPVDLQAGRVDGSLIVNLQQMAPKTTFAGTVTANQVTAQVANLPRKFINTTGQLKFQGNDILFENVIGRYGNIPVLAKGTINTQTGYNLSAQINAVSAKNLLNTLNVNLPFTTSGELQANLQVKGALQKPLLTGNVSTINTAKIDRVNFKNISSRFQITPQQVTLTQIQAVPIIGGQVIGNGRIGLGNQRQISLNFQAENIPGDALAKTYNFSLPNNININNVSATAKIFGTLGNLQTLAQVQVPTATYPGEVKVAINNQGTILLQDALFKIAGGTVAATGKLAQGNWQTTVNAQQIPLSRFAQVPQQFQGLVNSKFNLSGTTASFQPSAIQATGTANLNLAEGTVNLKNISLDNGRWQLIANASQIPLNQIAENLPAGQIASTNLNVSGTIQSFQPSAIQATGQANLNLAGGKVNLQDIRLNNGNWQTSANISQVQLNQLSEELRGRLNGQVQLAGMTQSFQLSDIRAAGQVRLNQIAQIQQPLTAQFRWNGEIVQILQATTSGLSATGTIGVQLQPTPQITALNLNVQAQDYNLLSLPLNLPGNIALAGTANFNGKVTGAPSSINADGNISLRNFAVNDLEFEPVLTGSVNFQQGQGTQLNLNGQQDQIALTLGANNRPTAFAIRQNGGIATLRTQGENLLLNVQDFPVAVLRNLVPGVGANLEPITGDISLDLAINLDQSTAVGDVAIAQPRLGRITGDEFIGRISFADGNFTLTDGELRQGENRFALSGNLPTAGNQPLQFQLSFDQARIQNVLQSLRIFDFQDVTTGLKVPEFAGAESLQTTPVGLPNANLITQLRRFSEIEALVAQQRIRRQETSRIPTLQELIGTVSGRVAVTGSLQSGINADFDLRSDDLIWGKYNIDEVVAQGNFENGVLTLLPLRVDLGEGLLAFNGQLGQNELSAQVRATEVPVDLIQPFIPNLPVEITGDLNALVTLAGSLNNPRAIGEVALVDGSLNNQPLKTAEVSFSYNNARLNFGSNVLAAGTEPLQITGSVPFKLPFASVQPDSSQISIQANAQNEGLAILNLFTNQVNWVSGQGQLNLTVQGTLDQPITNGIASIKNATINAQALTEPLTDVAGTIRFEGNTLIAENLQGGYSNGQVTANGILAIFAGENAQQQAATNPLTVSLDNLRLNLQELYRGEINGNIVIGGTALNPILGGIIRLSDGEISLLQSTSTNSSSTNSAAQTGQALINSPVRFGNLQFILDDDVRITREPLLSFVGQGDITLNGTLANPRPQGVINLESGQVNLFTTQFTLARGYEQTARFIPSQGFDPILDVRLFALIPEVSGSRIPTSPLSSEIEDVSTINFGTLNTVRVQARVTGLASTLNENLELTSEPARSEAEIVALIGGSFINAFGQENAVLGLVNLAGSTVLSDLQAAISNIGQTLGLSELRVYPTLVTDATRDTSVLGLAAEAVFDISEDFSVSLSRIFATNEFFRYNAIYRINDQIILRGSTNLDDESRALIEYESRF
ncbi:hypothetical protein NIES4071_08160 [Calothrix sp. NIES-4071]|nr:hypothetical protein NIES4071_08160 [Calothrix sp. NIES-4071]BAZ55158.1 hypothetical protein NIES4105_08120 [Calothrix sp. NIES-4105]